MTEKAKEKAAEKVQEEAPNLQKQTKLDPYKKGDKPKLAIVGCSDSKDQAPFDNQDYEIWGVNNLFYHIPRYDRWFEIHHITFDGKDFLRRGSKDFRGQAVTNYIADLGKMKCPVYMQKQWPQVPMSTQYPVKKIIDMFGDYFTNTISWMTALGIWMGFEEIGIWGVDMAVDTEYHWQRPSCEYFIGWFNGMSKALGRDTKIYIPPTADLMKARYLYGFQEPEEIAWRQKIAATKKHMGQKMEKAAQAEQQQHDLRMQYLGGIQAVREIDKIWK